MSEDLRERLQAYCAAAFPERENAQVGGLTALSAGWESDVYAFPVEYGPADARRYEVWVLRLYPRDFAEHKASHEFSALRLLHEAGYPVPQGFALERDPAPLGHPFVLMEKIEGHSLWPLLFHGPETQRPPWLALFCDLFVRLHALA